jgi:hypothetical protein
MRQSSRRYMLWKLEERGGENQGGFRGGTRGNVWHMVPEGAVVGM